MSESRSRRNRDCVVVVELFIEVLLPEQPSDLRREADRTHRYGTPIDRFDAHRIAAFGDGDEIIAIHDVEGRVNQKEDAVGWIQG
jgi:hypothetical protein